MSITSAIAGVASRAQPPAQIQPKPTTDSTTKGTKPPSEPHHHHHAASATQEANSAEGLNKLA
jgi:hypothetical protein